MSGSRTASSLEQLAGPLRRLTALRWSLTFGAGTALILALAAWALRIGVGPSPQLVLGAWLATGLVLALALWRAVVEWRSYRAGSLAIRLEALGVARRGSVVGLLGQTASGTSPELASVADTVRADAVLTGGNRALASTVSRVRAASLALACLLTGGLVTLAAARPGHGPSTLLWNPGRALEALLAPVRLTADPLAVDRGGTVRLEYEAAGQRSAVLWRRTPGELWTPLPVSLDSTGQGHMVLQPVESDLYFHLTSGSRSSDTIHVVVRLPAFLGSVRVTARYPSYLGLENETLILGPDPVLLPAGTVLVTEGVASSELARAWWQGRTSGRIYALDVRERGFGGEFRPSGNGEYDLRLATREGRPLAGEPALLSLVLVPDSIPLVQILVPGADTTAPADLRVALVVDIRDDHGLASARLVARGPGRADAARPKVVALELPAAMPQRLLLPTVLDLSGWGLKPGDTVRYGIEATDNSPAAQLGRSREYTVVVPTRADERVAQRAATAGAQAELDSLVAASQRLERQTADLAQARTRAETGGRNPERALGFEEARRAEAVAEGQEELMRRGEELEQTLDALRTAMEQGGTADSALARRLAEVTDQLAKALSPELRERLAELQRALEALDPERTREALQQLAEAQRELREALERSRELFERAALEGELARLAQDAKEVAEAQQVLNDEVAARDSTALAEREKGLAERTDSVAAGLEDAGKRMTAEETRAGIQHAAERARQAGSEMRNAASSFQRGQRQQARREGREAQAAMEQVARETGAERERQQDAWREEVMRALDRALAETARLSAQQLDVAESFRSSRPVATARRDQAAVEESVEKLLEQIRAVSGRNALVSPQIAVALAVARRNMGAARDAVSSGSPNAREAAQQAGEAVDALNVAAYAMARARQDVGAASSGSGLAEAMERMTRLAQQQGQLSQQANGMLPLPGQVVAAAQLQRLALEQRRLAEAMERMRAEGQVPGARDLAEESRELARRLDAGRLDRETVERQQRLFRRMLDAGRTLQGEETDERKERQSTAATDDAGRLPPALRRRLGEPLRLPSWEELRALSQEERRLVTEYFRRLAGQARP